MRSTDIMAVATVAATIALSGSVAADPLVVRSNGPSAGRYVPGQILAAGAKIALRKGDQLTLLDDRGVRVLSGPGLFMATGGPTAAAPSPLTALASNATQRRSRVGAVRRLPDGSLTRPNIFFIDSAISGPMCVTDPADAQIWRAKADSSDAWKITAGDGATTTLDWIKGQSAQAWPKTLPIKLGATYRIWEGSGAPVAIEFQGLETPPSDMRSLASGLIAHGCKGQIDMLVATTTSS